MEEKVRNWLLEKENPEMRLRVLKEYEKRTDEDELVIEAKKELLDSKIYKSIMKKLHSDKKWSKFDALLALAEWGLTREDISKELDEEVFGFIKENGFQVLCGEPLLLRNLVKLHYYEESLIKDEIDRVLKLNKEDGGFGCISTNKKINDPKKEHKSCARYTAEYLLLIAELKLKGIDVACEENIKQYFMKRNIFYRTDDMKTPMVTVMLETFFPADPIKFGVQYILYSLNVLGCDKQSEAMKAGYQVLDRYLEEDGTYRLSASKSVPAFKCGNVGEANKWITYYAYMAKR